MSKVYTWFGFVSVIVAVVLGLYFGLNGLASYECNNRYMAYTSYYKYNVGCFVVVNNKLTPVSMVKIITQ